MEKQKVNRILIEPLLFGDYAVAVYDEHDTLVLDRKYYCRGYLSAVFTAINIKGSLFDGDIYQYDLEEGKEKKADISKYVDNLGLKNF